MPDNSSLPVASGNETFANHDVSGIKYPRAKLTWGPTSATTPNDVDVAANKPLPTQMRHSDGTIVTDATGIKISTAQLAALATTAQPIATGAQLVTLPTDVGLPVYAKSADFVSGAVTTPMTATADVTLLAAPAAGLRNYITQITVSNAHATNGTDVVIKDGATVLYTIPAAPAYGGAVLTFPVPLRQPTLATAITVANITTNASTKVSASGYKAA